MSGQVQKCIKRIVGEERTSLMQKKG